MLIKTCFDNKIVPKPERWLLRRLGGTNFLLYVEIYIYILKIEYSMKPKNNILASKVFVIMVKLSRLYYTSQNF